MNQVPSDSHRPPLHLHAPFGADSFGRRAESFARFFGTPKFLIGQTILVIVWIGLNALGLAFDWDPYPFILLNLMFSLQAAYAAPLILLAQTRQADRDKAMSEADTAHRESLALAALGQQQAAGRETAQLRDLLDLNTKLTEQVERLTSEIHATVVAEPHGQS